MNSRQRIVKALQVPSDNGLWTAHDSLKSSTGLPQVVLDMVLADLEADQVLESSGPSGYLRNRVRLSRQMGPLMGEKSSAAPADVADVEATVFVDPTTTELTALPLTRSFSAMASIMMANETDRLKQVTGILASKDMKDLPCLAVTNDLDTAFFMHRRTKAMDKVCRSTGFDVYPSGPTEFFTMSHSKNGKSVSIDSPGAAPALVQSPAQLLYSSPGLTLNTAGKILSVKLPKGGNATPSEIVRIEKAGPVTVLQFDRCVNAKMIMLTPETVNRLVHCLDHAPLPAEQRRPGGDFQNVSVSNDVHTLVVESSVRFGESAAGKITINGAKGGKATMSSISSVLRTGPVFMLNLDRRVNAKSITISNHSGAELRKTLSEMIPLAMAG